MERSNGRDRGPTGARASRRARHGQIRELVREHDIQNQQQLADLLTAQGFEVTQATVSRDIAELGLVKVPRGERHVYAAPAELVATRPRDDEMLLRVLRDVPVEVRRSGLILVLVASAGTASILAEAIDLSTLDDQVGTLAGDNTVLVLFSDEARLEHWRSRFEALTAGRSRP
ncbi:MAG: arginine repressor [Chloroflexi bacterium]|nr:arginine repressor [Chloroflexota bacterium]